MSNSTHDDDLRIDSMDPVTFQIIKHRLERITDEAVEALKRVSGAPNTNEGHDLMVALYTSDGDLLTGGVGFLHHYLGASEATKHVIDRFEGEINEGDMFLLNDPYTAALHPPDVYIICPIFFEGELKAFSASFVHVADIGAVDAGGFAPNSTSVFHEGFQTPGLKLIEEGEVRQDVLDTIRNMSRDPGMIELDLRSEIAANNVARDRMRDLMAEHGADTIETVGNELISQSSKRFKKRLRELPDGRFEERQYLDSAPEDEMFTVQVALEKRGDSLTFDFSGTSGESEYGLNCTRIATVGGVLAPVFPLLCQDMTWNDGIIDAVDVNAPEGTIVNAERPAPISIATIATLQMCNSLSTLAVSKLLGASEEYADRATGVWHGAHCHVSVEIEYEDETHVEGISDTFAGAGGARAFADGVDLGGEVVNVVARWGNAERHEAVLPLMYLYRQFVEDSGGPGEFRGGVGHEYALAPIPFDDVEQVDVVNLARGVEIPNSTGVFGGYPGCNIEYAMYDDVPLGSVETFPPTKTQLSQRGDPRYTQWGVETIEEDGVFAVRLPGSGGYGDPLDRDANAVAADVVDGKIAPETASEVYGVPVGDDGTPSEEVSTIRDRKRSARLEAADPPERSLDVDVTGTSKTAYRLGANLSVERVEERAYVRCDGCGSVLAPASTNWKEYASVAERPVSQAGTNSSAPEGYCLREFYCPDCGTLLDTEVAHEDDPPLVSQLSL
ncbi:MAG: hydantoinase B/oxoprolinase family protein [Halorubrum sp.]